MTTELREATTMIDASCTVIRAVLSAEEARRHGRLLGVCCACASSAAQSALRAFPGIITHGYCPSCEKKAIESL